MGESCGWGDGNGETKQHRKITANIPASSDKEREKEDPS
jgi:hypothetical protein